MALGAFGIIAILLAALGLCGVVAYSVARRRREIAIRSAVGATARQVALLFAVIGVVASGLPARRALRVQPQVALRDD